MIHKTYKGSLNLGLEKCLNTKIHSTKHLRIVYTTVINSPITARELIKAVNGKAVSAESGLLVELHGVCRFPIFMT